MLLVDGQVFQETPAAQDIRRFVIMGQQREQGGGVGVNARGDVPPVTAEEQQCVRVDAESFPLLLLYVERGDSTAREVGVVRAKEFLKKPAVCVRRCSFDFYRGTVVVVWVPRPAVCDLPLKPGQSRRCRAPKHANGGPGSGIARPTRSIPIDATGEPGEHRVDFRLGARASRAEDASLTAARTGKRRNAADVLALEGEKSVTILAAMVGTVWLYENGPDFTWSGGAAAVINHQIVASLALHPKLRDYIAVGDQLSAAIGMIKNAAWAASYLVAQANPKADLSPWFDGVIEGAGLPKGG